MKNTKLRNEIASFVSKKNICKRFVVVLLLTLLSSCSKEKLDGVSADFEKKLSNYKHINNGGIKDNEILPYNIDAITGATMTIEGAGVYTSIPLSVREIENTTNGQVRGKYRDKNGVFNYEGLDLYYLLNDMKDGDNGIKLTDKSYKIKACIQSCKSQRLFLYVLAFGIRLYCRRNRSPTAPPGWMSANCSAL